MPLKVPADAPGTAQHVTSRGIEQKSLFPDTIDQATFIERFVEIVLIKRLNQGHRKYAYCRY